MLWKHIWTSCLINVNRTLHPYFIAVATNGGGGGGGKDRRLQTRKMKTTKFDAINHHISEQTNLDGLIDAFHIITNHYTNNTNFLSLECVSPNVAVLLNHHNHKKHSINILQCKYEVLRIRTIPKEVRSIENWFFGMCNKKISYEILCGMVGPETSDMIARPHRIEMDVKLTTKEEHTLNSKSSTNFVIHNTHYWKFCSDIEKIEWILDDIRS
jgi:hypothetical protein